MVTVLDQMVADHPDPEATRTVELLAAESADGVDGVDGGLEFDIDARVAPADGVDPDLLESWDEAFASSLRSRFAISSDGDEAVADLTIAVGDETRLATLLHAAAGWLGVAALPLASVRLVAAVERERLEAMRATFAREKERHLSPHLMDLPAVDWLEAEDQFLPAAREAWSFVNSLQHPEVSRRQLFAIRLYTSEFYLAFHRALRARRGDDAVYRAMLPLVASLDAGLENLPPVVETTYRGELLDEETGRSRGQLTEDSVFAEPSYVSSSRDEKHARALRRGFLFRISGRTGRDISAFSPFPWEREVLFGRGLVQRVLAKETVEDAYGEEAVFDTVARPSRLRGLRSSSEASQPTSRTS